MMRVSCFALSLCVLLGLAHAVTTEEKKKEMPNLEKMEAATAKAESKANHAEDKAAKAIAMALSAMTGAGQAKEPLDEKENIDKNFKEADGYYSIIETLVNLKRNQHTLSEHKQNVDVTLKDAQALLKRIKYEQTTDDFSCLPGEAEVQMRTGGSRRMADLAVGDEILVEQTPGVFAHEPVLAFFHRQLPASAEYRHVVHDGGVLRASASHLVLVDGGRGAREAKPAAALREGDLLLLGAGAAPSAVRRVETRSTAEGMYAPVTAAGTLVVDGAVVSSYASPKALGFHLRQATAHAATFPLRLAARLGFPLTTGKEVHPFATAMYFATRGLAVVS